MSEIDLPAFLASRLRKAGAKIEKLVGKMPADRQSWQPSIEGNNGRDTLDQLGECALLNGWCAVGFQAGQLASPDWDAYTAQKAALDTPEKVLAAFKEGTEAMAAALEACSPSHLGETFLSPFSGKETTWAEFADFMYWNMSYHEGQISYIQTLYGDVS